MQCLSLYNYMFISIYVVKYFHISVYFNIHVGILLLSKLAEYPKNSIARLSLGSMLLE